MSEQAINPFHEGVAQEQAPYVPSQEALSHPEGAAVGVFVELFQKPTRAALVATLEARGKGHMAEAFGHPGDQAISQAA